MGDGYQAGQWNKFGEHALSGAVAVFAGVTAAMLLVAALSNRSSTTALYG